MFMLAVLLAPAGIFAQDKTARFHLGGGVGYGNVTLINPFGENRDKAAINAALHIGISLSEMLGLHLEFERHGSNESVSCENFPNAQVIATRLLFLSLQIGRQLYLRPALGVGEHDFSVGNFNGNQCRQIDISNELGLAFGLALGWRNDLSERISLATEGLFRYSRGEDSSAQRRMLALQLRLNYHL